MNIQNVLPALRREHLFPFVWATFEFMHPGQRFVASSHVEAICHALEKVAKGETRRLIITVPPRHGKSICTAVAFAAWLLGRDPGLKIMVASYGNELATKHARDFRNVVTSPFYKALFPRMRLASDRTDEQITTANGGRKAVSLGGAATGFGADLIVIDDLMKAGDASSPTERQRVRDYYEQTLLSRLNDKAAGRVVVIQQRLHEDDLVGYLLGTGQFEHLDLPAIAVRDEVVPLCMGHSWMRKTGTPLCPERESLETLKELRVQMGPAAFSAQYQQDPTPPGGNRIRWEWFQTYQPEPFERSVFQFVVQSWDTGMTAEPTSDFSVCTTWGFRSGKWHLLDVERARYDFPDLKRRSIFLAKRYVADKVLVEKAGSGFSLVQQIRLELPGGERFSFVTPRLDKVSRVEAQSARLETGNYLLPTDAPWLETLRRELLAFPNGRHDDQVDSVIQFVEWSASPRGSDLVERDPKTGRPLRSSRPQHRWRPLE